MILDLTSVDETLFADLRSLVIESRQRHSPISAVAETAIPRAHRVAHNQVTLVLPVVPSEVWGAGVTFTRSREARKRETRFGQIYEDVYGAERPELFLKDPGGRRCAPPGDYVSVRSDSQWTVPEPELAVVLDDDAEVIGYTIANDVSARDIEGENPLYLPQAKTFIHSCSFGPVIVTPDELREPERLEIRMRIARAGRILFQGTTNTSTMRRHIGELVGYLKRDNVLGEATILMTGTGIVPPDDVSLIDGDIVEIDIERIGTLRNPVRKLQ